MKKQGININEAPESFRRPEKPPAAPPSIHQDEDLICPVCEGSGEGWTMSDSSPDAHMIQVDCGECSGSGSLHGAYQTVKFQRDSLSTRLSDAGGQMLFMRIEIDKLRAELAGLRKDAERYRWLRRQPDDCSAPRIDICHWTLNGDDSVNEGEGLRGDAADIAIDASMAKEASHG